MVYIVMGVAGTGKTTVGRLLAGELKIPFLDGDDYHPESSKLKMKRGIPLDEADRVPWLMRLAAEIAGVNGRPVVLACSALRQSHRDLLAANAPDGIVFIHLTGPAEVIRNRLEGRRTHYFPPALLDSQLETLEPPQDAMTVSIEANPEEIVRKISAELERRGLMPK